MATFDPTPYSAATPQTERIKNVLARLYGTESTYESRMMYRSVVAISGSESSFVWSNPPLPAEKAIFKCPNPTTVIGLEPKDGNYDRMELINGFSTPGARKNALMLGLVKAEIVGGEERFLATGAKAGNGEGQHQLFQLALLHRDTRLAKGFSIGPTQMYLLYSAALGGTDPDRGANWSDLYSLYLSADPQKIWPRLKYAWSKGPPFPASAPDDRERGINWLKRTCQAGCSDANATKYYDTYYKNNLKKVIAADGG